jgi:hypothetical protein
MTDLFPTAPAGAAKEKTMALFDSIRASIRSLSEASPNSESGLTTFKSPAIASADPNEIVKLKSIIRTLRHDLGKDLQAFISI